MTAQADVVDQQDRRENAKTMVERKVTSRTVVLETATPVPDRLRRKIESDLQANELVRSKIEVYAVNASGERIQAVREVIQSVKRGANRQETRANHATRMQEIRRLPSPRGWPRATQAALRHQ